MMLILWGELANDDAVVVVVVVDGGYGCGCDCGKMLADLGSLMWNFLEALLKCCHHLMSCYNLVRCCLMMLSCVVGDEPSGGGCGGDCGASDDAEGGGYDGGDVVVAVGVVVIWQLSCAIMWGPHQGYYCY